jgi:hypothetical protein
VNNKLSSKVLLINNKQLASSDYQSKRIVASTTSAGKRSADFGRDPKSFQLALALLLDKGLLLILYYSFTIDFSKALQVGGC